MKVNMPVTDTEVHMSDTETLVSKTDLKGAITYVNKEFIQISGFTEAELIGVNHNIVRHPDMPPEAFQDLWDTLKAGRPWIQLVKNRTKQGNYYWVKANVTPVMDNGQVVEYMSVRTKPSREEIAGAKAAFDQLKRGKIKLDHGNVSTTGVKKVLGTINRISIAKQFFGIGIIFALLVALIGWELRVQHETVEFSAKELLGAEYITPIRTLLEKVPEHRGMTNAYLNGNKTFEPQILQRREEINATFKKAFVLDERLGGELKTTQKLNALKSAWDSLQNTAFSLNAPESFRQHSALIRNIQDLIVHAGDTSNLILDPDLDSFYAMDLVINKIPRLVEYMGQARGLGAGVIAAGYANEQQRERLIELMVSLDLGAAGVKASYTSGAEFSQETVAVLGAQAKSAIEAVDRFQARVLQLRQGNFSGDAQEFFGLGSRAISESFGLYDQTNAYLTELLERRVSKLDMKFNVIAFSTLFATLLVALSGFLVSRHILHTIRECLCTFYAIANGNYRYDIPMEGNNELTELTRSINSMRIKLGFDIEDSQARAAATQRIKEALDVCQTNVMLADESNNIIYMNHSIHGMFETAETDIRKDLPEFDAKKVLGENMDVFHKNPAHQQDVISKIKEPYNATIKIGGRTFALMATPVFGADGARMGTVVEWQDRTDILAQLEKEQRVANENLRIREALDNVSANVMVADKDRNIIYMNDAVIATLRNAQEDMRKDLPNFDVDKLQGASIDAFHKHPEHQIQLLENLKTTYNASIVVGGRHMDLAVNPIRNKAGERLGTVVEWKDRTIEVAVEKEIDQLVEAASHGDLTQRIALDGKSGFFHKLSTGLNDLVESASQILGDVGATIEAMAEGDLTRQIATEYRGEFETIRKNANLTNEKLSTIISQIREAANTVNTAANEIAQGNADLSQRTEEQASSLEETASSMEQMTSTVKQSADAANEANSLSLDARKKAQSGGEVVHQAIQAMGEILKASNRINDIIGVIDEIAFQTNLLALNAAVEAARAGEQGRGFAVVAGEVRNLSQRSAAAAKEIKDLIKDSVVKVEAGSTLVNESGDTLTALVHAVEKVAHMISEISNAANEQTSGIEQINQAVAQMDEMTQQNAALVEEASAASEAMSDQASNMNKLVSFFRLGDVTETYTATPARATGEELKTYQPARPPSAPGKASGGHSSFADDDDDWEEF